MCQVKKTIIKQKRDILKSGENRFSFETPADEKINALFSALADVSGYIFVDCTNDEADEISKRALVMAGVAVRVMRVF